MKQIPFISLAICLALSTSLFGGVKITSKSQNKGCGQPASEGTSSMMLRSDIMRMDVKDNKSNVSMIFKKKDQKMWVIDHAEKKYFSISKKELDALNDQFAIMKQSMEATLAQMPEEQREMMEKQMAKQFGTLYSDPAEVKYVKQSESKTVNGWRSQKYHHMKGEQLEGVMWTIGPEQVNLTNDDFQILRDFSEFIKSQFESFSFGGGQGFVTPEQDFEGIPVETIDMKDGQECSTSTVESIEKTTLEDALFQIPKDYLKAENPMKAGK